MLTKEEFVLEMQELQKLDKELDEFCGITEKYFEGAIFNLGFKLFDKTINLLCILMDDEDSKTHDSWIHWFIYENEWGKREFTVSTIIGKKGKKIKTIEQLYDLLVRDKDE